jgi:N-acetylmuramic acid 6-phosphate etherase
MTQITESDSLYQNLEQMSLTEILDRINYEDSKVHKAVHKELPKIRKFVEQLVKRVQAGGRLFYIGAGSSGRLGVLDASEIPPTFGMPKGIVIGLIAGNNLALQNAVEGAEDDIEAAWKEILNYAPNSNDSIIGIAASGETPYVIGGIRDAKKNGLLTAAITCNLNSSLAKEVDISIEPIVGPEFITGSTRMKAGTAQKMVLNMISTSLMIKLGKIKGNQMVDMQLSNKKLIKRGTRMIIQELGIGKKEAFDLLKKHGSVRKAVAKGG